MQKFSKHHAAELQQFFVTVARAIIRDDIEQMQDDSVELAAADSSPWLTTLDEYSGFPQRLDRDLEPRAQALLSVAPRSDEALIISAANSGHSPRPAPTYETIPAADPGLTSVHQESVMAEINSAQADADAVEAIEVAPTAEDPIKGMPADPELDTVPDVHSEPESDAQSTLAVVDAAIADALLAEPLQADDLDNNANDAASGGSVSPLLADDPTPAPLDEVAGAGAVDASASSDFDADSDTSQRDYEEIVLAACDLAESNAEAEPIGTNASDAGNAEPLSHFWSASGADPDSTAVDENAELLCSVEFDDSDDGTVLPASDHLPTAITSDDASIAELAADAEADLCAATSLAAAALAAHFADDPVRVSTLSEPIAPSVASEEWSAELTEAASVTAVDPTDSLQLSSSTDDSIATHNQESTDTPVADAETPDAEIAARASWRSWMEAAPEAEPFLAAAETPESLPALEIADVAEPETGEASPAVMVDLDASPLSEPIAPSLASEEWSAELTEAASVTAVDPTDSLQLSSSTDDSIATHNQESTDTPALAIADVAEPDTVEFSPAATHILDASPLSEPIAPTPSLASEEWSAESSEVASVTAADPPEPLEPLSLATAETPESALALEIEEVAQTDTVEVSTAEMVLLGASPLSEPIKPPFASEEGSAELSKDLLPVAESSPDAAVQAKPVAAPAFETSDTHTATRDTVEQVDSPVVLAPIAPVDPLGVLRSVLADELRAHLSGLYLPQVEAERSLRMAAESRLEQSEVARQTMERELREQNDAARHSLELELREQGEALSVLRSELGYFGDRNTRLEASVSELTAETRTLRDQARMADAQHQSLRTILAQRERDEQTLRRDNERLALESQQIESARLRLQKDVDSLRIDFGRLLEERKSINETIASRDEQIRALNEKVAQYEQLITDINDQLAGESHHAVQLQELLDAERDRHTEMAEHIQALEAELDNTQAELQKAHAELQKAHAELQKAHAELARAPRSARRSDDSFLSALPAAPTAPLVPAEPALTVVEPVMAPSAPSPRVEVPPISAEQLERERRRLQVLSRKTSEVPAKLFFQAIPWDGLVMPATLRLDAASGSGDATRDIGMFAVAAATAQAVSASAGYRSP